MAKLPRSPDPTRLPPVDPGDIKELTPADPIWRVYPATGGHPMGWNHLRHYGPIGARFDTHPMPAGTHPDHAVWYGASDLTTAIAEVFQRSRVVSVRSRNPFLVKLRLGGSVELLDLTGNWITRAGASQAISTGPRSSARAWARAIHTVFPAIDGVWYRSSMSGTGFGVALWHGAAAELGGAVPLLSLPLSDPALWDPLALLCERLEYRLR